MLSTLIERMLEGDSAATELLWREFQPQIVRAVRFQLRHYEQGTSDFLVEDIAQDVAERLVEKLREDRTDSRWIKEPNRLLGLLKKIARDFIADRRRERGKKSHSPLPPELEGKEVTAHENAVERELLNRGLQLLAHGELQIAEARLAGKRWDEIAQKFGQPAETLQKRYYRAVRRLRKMLQDD